MLLGGPGAASARRAAAAGTSSCHEIAANRNRSDRRRPPRRAAPASPATRPWARSRGCRRRRRAPAPRGGRARQRPQRRRVAHDLVDGADRARRARLARAQTEDVGRRLPVGARAARPGASSARPRAVPRRRRGTGRSPMPCSRHLVSMPISTAGSSTSTSKLVWRGRSPSSAGSTTCANSIDGTSLGGGRQRREGVPEPAERRDHGWPRRRAARRRASGSTCADRWWRCQGLSGIASAGASQPGGSAATRSRADVRCSPTRSGWSLEVARVAGAEAPVVATPGGPGTRRRWRRATSGERAGGRSGLGRERRGGLDGAGSGAERAPARGALAGRRRSGRAGAAAGTLLRHGPLGPPPPLSPLPTRSPPCRAGRRTRPGAGRSRRRCRPGPRRRCRGRRSGGRRSAAPPRAAAPAAAATSAGGGVDTSATTSSTIASAAATASTTSIAPNASQALRLSRPER